MSEELRLIIIGVVIVLCAFGVGPKVARRARETEPLYGGSIPQLFNLTASMAVSALIPGALTTLLMGFGHNALYIVGTCLSIIIISLIGLSVVEVPAHKVAMANKPQDDDDAWTEEKARTSGL